MTTQILSQGTLGDRRYELGAYRSFHAPDFLPRRDVLGDVGLAREKPRRLARHRAADDAFIPLASVAAVSDFQCGDWLSARPAGRARFPRPAIGAAPRTPPFRHGGDRSTPSRTSKSSRRSTTRAATSISGVFTSRLTTDSAKAEIACSCRPGIICGLCCTCGCIRWCCMLVFAYAILARRCSAAPAPCSGRSPT